MDKIENIFYINIIYSLILFLKYFLYVLVVKNQIKYTNSVILLHPISIYFSSEIQRHLPNFARLEITNDAFYKPK